MPRTSAILVSTRAALRADMEKVSLGAIFQNGETGKTSPRGAAGAARGCAQLFPRATQKAGDQQNISEETLLLQNWKSISPSKSKASNHF